MIASYGYKDGAGEFFISIDTGKCAGCKDKSCVDACPASIFEVIVDDYDDEVIRVKEEHRNKLKYTCAPCKPAGGERVLPCQKECHLAAISHSW